MKLSELNRGESGKILKIEAVSEFKKRLIDMGIGTGSKITLKRNAPLGDPQEFRINNNSIAIRKIDAEKIEIEKIEKK
ncbi:MAG: FeoA family protein [Fusobacteriaceae bacterium]